MKKEKYRSSRRGVRIISPKAARFPQSRPPNSPQEGKFSFRRIDPDFSSISEAASQKSVEITQSMFGDDIERIRRIIDVEYRLSSYYFWVIDFEPYAQINEVTPLLKECYIQNFFSLYSAYDLTNRGLYGPARPLLRHTFESLIISKYCSINSDSDVYDKWIDGMTIYFGNAVLNKIEKPPISDFKNFWGYICMRSHSSPHSMQRHLQTKISEEEISLNYVLIQILLECNYHILNSHILTPSVKYYQDRYGGSDKATVLKIELRRLFKSSRDIMGNDARKLIRSYKSTWVIRPQ